LRLQISKHGLDIMLRLVNSRDSVTLLFFVNPDVETAEVVDPLRDYYEHELEEYGPPDSKYVQFTTATGHCLYLLVVLSLHMSPMSESYVLALSS
jgi:hypothetical protein